MSHVFHINQGRGIILTLQKIQKISETHDEGQRFLQSLTNIVTPSGCVHDLKKDDLLTHDKGEQRAWSLPNIVEPSECVRSSFNISVSESDVSSEYEDAQCWSDNESLTEHQESHFHEGINLAGDDDNSVQIIHDIEARNPKTMLATPSKGKRSFFVISDGSQVIHIILSHQMVLDVIVSVTFVECMQLCNFPQHCNGNMVVF